MASKGDVGETFKMNVHSPLGHHNDCQLEPRVGPGHKELGATGYQDKGGGGSKGLDAWVKDGISVGGTLEALSLHLATLPRKETILPRRCQEQTLNTRIHLLCTSRCPKSPLRSKLVKSKGKATRGTILGAKTRMGKSWWTASWRITLPRANNLQASTFVRPLAIS